jgi:MYXO-CTERM domain-containing protein
MKIFKRSLMVLPLAASLSTASQAQITYLPHVEWPVASGGNGHRYQAVRVEQGISWTAARDLAVSTGGYLASIHSVAENQLVWNIMKGDASLWSSGGYQGCWLGGFQPAGSSEPGGGWSWTSGEAWTFAAWGGGEPNNAAGYEHHLNLMDFGGGFGHSGNIGWNDMEQAGGLWGPMRSFIIEYPIPSPGSGLLGLVAIGVIGRGRRRPEWHKTTIGSG